MFKIGDRVKIIDTSFYLRRYKETDILIVKKVRYDTYENQQYISLENDEFNREWYSYRFELYSETETLIDSVADVQNGWLVSTQDQLIEKQIDYFEITKNIIGG